LLLLPQLLKVKRFWGSSHKVKLRALSTLPHNSNICNNLDTAQNYNFILGIQKKYTS